MDYDIKYKRAFSYFMFGAQASYVFSQNQQVESSIGMHIICIMLRSGSGNKLSSISSTLNIFSDRSLKGGVTCY